MLISFAAARVRSITNPLPFARFLDFVYIGEAESGLSEIITILGKYKSRAERIAALKETPYLWYPGKNLSPRAVDLTFGTADEKPLLKHYAVSSFAGKELCQFVF